MNNANFCVVDNYTKNLERQTNRWKVCNINARCCQSLSFSRSINKDKQYFKKKWAKATERQPQNTLPHVLFCFNSCTFFFLLIPEIVISQASRNSKVGGTALLAGLTVFFGRCIVLIISLSRLIFFHVPQEFPVNDQTFLLLNDNTKWRFYILPFFHPKECIDYWSLCY